MGGGSGSGAGDGVVPGSGSGTGVGPGNGSGAGGGSGEGGPGNGSGAGGGSGEGGGPGSGLGGGDGSGTGMGWGAGGMGSVAVARTSSCWLASPRVGGKHMVMPCCLQGLRLPRAARSRGICARRPHDGRSMHATRLSICDITSQKATTVECDASPRTAGSEACCHNIARVRSNGCDASQGERKPTSALA
jgi:hypothetical protein